jgi:tight adherence protein C
LAGHLASLSLHELRLKIEQKLKEAGRPLGMDSNDFLAMSILGGVAVGICGAALSVLLGKGAGAGVIIGAVFGASLPFFKVDEITQKRRIAASKGLPYAIDLAALSLEAGLDFTGALTQVISQMKPSNPIRFEFEHLLHKISLGSSRRDALEELADRIPTTQVCQFVNSVIQADERGTPLARVLSTQAEVMRTKRSQAAEQAAARAAILILGPLMLIFSCVFIILLGPFAIKFIRGEMF